MSIYAELLCHNCRQSVFLGKAMCESNGTPFAFHIGNDPTPHWKRDKLNKVIWKFLADHAAHNIDVRMEHQLTENMYAYQEIGGDAVGDISIEDYLKDWKQPGFTA